MVGLKNRLLFIHVPKAAGTSFNSYIEKNVDRAVSHVEGMKSLEESKLLGFDYVSGHVSFSRFESLFNLSDWKTIAIFREPYSYAISHLSWVRKLADPGEEERFRSHPRMFQTVALKMAELDLSQPSQIKLLIDWMRSVGFTYMFNTQLAYLFQRANEIKDDREAVSMGLLNLAKINYVGVADQVDLFKRILDEEFGFDTGSGAMPKENINRNTYGMNIEDEQIRAALDPFVNRDKEVYAAAKDRFLLLREKHDNQLVCSVSGYVDTIEEQEVSGWVVGCSGGGSLVVELEINGAVKSSQVANLFRPGILEKGLHATGRCGFRFALND